MDEPLMVLGSELEHLPTDGGDTVIATKPPTELTMDILQQLADDMAAIVGCRLHHAEFVLTTDPAVVRSFGIFPLHIGCEECEAGVERGIAHLERHPDSPLLVGQLHWADVGRPARRRPGYARSGRGSKPPDPGGKPPGSR